VSLGKAFNEIASTFEWVRLVEQMAAWLEDQKGHLAKKRANYARI